MKLKKFISWASFLLWATVLSIPFVEAQSVVSPSGSSNNKSTAVKPVALSLEFDSFAQFINDALKEKKVSGKISIPGLGDADKISLKNSKIALGKIVVKSDSLVADLQFGSTKGKIAAFLTGTSDKAVMAVTLDTLAFSDLVPGAAGSALKGVAVDKLTLVIVPAKAHGLRPNDKAIPKEIAANLKTVLDDAAKHDPTKRNYTLKAGFNFIADLDIHKSESMSSLMSSGGLHNSKVIPVVGTISHSMFDKTASRADQLKGLALSASLPDLKVPGLPKSIKITKPVFAITETAPEAFKQPEGSTPAVGPFVTIGADLVMTAGKGTHEFDSLLMVGKDAKGKSVIDLMGSAKDPKGLFEFQGLAVKTLDLASVYDGKNWDFQLKGTSDLNGTEVDVNTEITSERGKVKYAATLTAPKGITAKDITDHDIPGFDKVALDKIVVTSDSLVADMEFGPKKTKGEIAAFHVGTSKKAVMAVTFDKLAFSDLVPGAAGSSLDGVAVDKLTLVIVPPKVQGLKPDDEAIPEEIAANLKAVLADANQEKGFTLKENINLFAELDLKGSKTMGKLMNFIGRKPTKAIPLTGVMGTNMFSKTSKGKDSFKGMNLNVPMPKIKLGNLPGAFSFENAEFKITDADPSGNEGLWVGLVSELHGDMMGEKIEFDSEIGFSDGNISLVADSEMTLKAPFGIKWLTIKELALNLDYESTTSSDKKSSSSKKSSSAELEFTASTVIGKTPLDISIDLQEEGGKLTAGILNIEGELAFTELPMLAKIPHADKFAFTSLEISSSGIFGASLLHGQEVDAVIFEQNKKWTFAVADDGGGEGFKFGRIMPPIKKTPLGDFHLNTAALIFSQADISETVDQLPDVAQPVFSKIYGSDDAKVNIKNGIAVAAVFSPGNSSGHAAKGLPGIGLHDDVLIEGTLENIFGGKKAGSPGVDILVQMEQGPGGSKGATHSPKMAEFPSEVGFFITYKAEELDVGLSADTVLHLPNKQTLELDTKMYLEITEKGFGVDMFLAVENWDEPFGIPGFTLEEVALKLGITDLGECKLGVAAAYAMTEEQRIDMAAEIDFLLEAEGLPDAFAIRGFIKEIDNTQLILIAEKMAGGKAKISSPNSIPLPVYKDVTFAFATPGATDPQLGLVTEGFMLAGELFFMGRELGKVNVHAGPTGVGMKALIDPIDLTVLNLVKNKMRMDLNFTSLPVLEIDSEIEFLGMKQDVIVDFKDGLVSLGFEQKIGGGIWDSEITFGFAYDGAVQSGASDSEGKKDKTPQGVPDIYLEGHLTSDFNAWLTDQAPAKVRKYLAMLMKSFEAAEKKIKDAEAVVNSLNSRIAHRKEVVQREQANAKRAIQSAANRVNAVKRDVDYAGSKLKTAKNKCDWKHPKKCIEVPYWASRKGAEEAAYGAAKGVLNAAKSAVAHMPSELMDPELLGLEAAHGGAMSALQLAKRAIDGVEGADAWMSDATGSLMKGIAAANALEIKEIYFEGDLHGILNGEPLLLGIDLEIFGDDLGMQHFAFSLTDAEFAVQQLAYVPLHMVTKLFQNSIPKNFKNLMGPVLAAINQDAGKAQKGAQKALEKVPGQNLPADVKEALKASLSPNDQNLDIFGIQEGGMFGYPDTRLSLLTDTEVQNLDSFRIPEDRMIDYPDTRLAFLMDAEIQNDSSEMFMILAQAASPVPSLSGMPPASGSAPPSADKASPRDKMSHSEKFEAYIEKKKNLLANSVLRNKAFGQAMVDFTNQQSADRAARENDMFVPHTDLHVPPGELFTEKLLVARHSNLCLGQNGTGKITFHACSENPGGLLWGTGKKLVNLDGHLIPWDAGFAAKFPNLVYTEIQHNGACLTTPFHLEVYDTSSKAKHAAALAAIAKAHPENEAAHLTLAACRADAKGQLWKLVKITHDIAGNKHGFKIMERDSGYCLQPETVKAHTNKKSKEVNAVFYPCLGIAHGTFELTIPNNDLPVWFDHNGVIKSDNGYCLDVPDDVKADRSDVGTVVYLKECTDDEFDRWDYVVDYGKKVKIINDFTGHCLYPYDHAEGSIPQAKTGQLVQRPCDARYGQGWKMRVIPNQKWFQLESVDSSNKGTNKCMLPAEPNPSATVGKVYVFVESCKPATRGRWQFGHWEGVYQWTEWTSSESSTLSTTYWVSADSLTAGNKNGVCRVISGNHSTTNYKIYPGTWYGSTGICSYLLNGSVKALDASSPGGGDIVVEVLSGLDIGESSSTGSWKSSTGSIPKDSAGQNTHPPTPSFTAFLAGGDTAHPASFLCRIKSSTDDTWRYGYQSTSTCQTDATSTSGSPVVLTFKTVKNTDTGN